MQNSDDITYQGMKNELPNSGDQWRFVETLARKAGVNYEKAIQLLYEDPEVVFSVNRESQRLLAKLTAQNSVRIPSGITFDRKSVSIGNATIPYLVHRPPNYSRDSKWPVILFLHGSGERGNDGVRQMRAGLGPTLRRHSDRYPALVVMPQLPFGPGWHHQIDGVNTNDLILGALEQTLDEYTGDPNRQYLTGISMGAFGCWFVASQHHDRFAAMVSICGGIYSNDDPHARARKLTNLDIWVFHGEADQHVSVWCSRRIVDAAKAVGSTKIRYTEINDDKITAGEFTRKDHFIWDEIYSKNNVADWLLAQQQES